MICKGKVENPNTPLKPIFKRPEVAVVVTRAGVARVALVQHLGLRKSDQCDEPAQEGVRLAQAAQLLDHAPANQAKIAGVARDRHLGDLVDQPVAETGDHALDPGLALRVRTRRAVTTSKPSCALLHRVSMTSGGSCRSTSMTAHQSPRQLRIPAMVAAGCPKRRLKTSRPMPRIARGLLADDGFGPIRRWIEAEDDLVGSEPLEHRHDAIKKGTDVSFFLVDRHHDGDQWYPAAVGAIGQACSRLHEHRHSLAQDDKSLMVISMARFGPQNRRIVDCQTERILPHDLDVRKETAIAIACPMKLCRHVPEIGHTGQFRHRIGDQRVETSPCRRVLQGNGGMDETSAARYNASRYPYIAFLPHVEHLTRPSLRSVVKASVAIPCCADRCDAVVSPGRRQVSGRWPRRGCRWSGLLSLRRHSGFA